MFILERDSWSLQTSTVLVESSNNPGILKGMLHMPYFEVAVILFSATQSRKALGTSSGGDRLCCRRAVASLCLFYFSWLRTTCALLPIHDEELSELRRARSELPRCQVFVRFLSFSHLPFSASQSEQDLGVPHASKGLETSPHKPQNQWGAVLTAEMRSRRKSRRHAARFCSQTTVSCSGLSSSSAFTCLLSPNHIQN